MQNFRFDRLDELLKASSPKITRKSLCLKAHHADNYIRMFEKRGTNPPVEFIEFCATELGTTSSYLLGKTDDPSPAEQKEKAPQSDEARLTEGLNDENIKKLYEYAKLLKLGQTAEKEMS